MNLKYTEEELSNFLTKILNSEKSYVEKVQALEKYSTYAPYLVQNTWHM